MRLCFAKINRFIQLTKTRQSGLNVIGQKGDPQKISSSAGDMPLLTIVPIGKSEPIQAKIIFTVYLMEHDC